MKIIYGKREHRGTLEESLKTKKEITDKEFSILVNYYTYYGYDKRCNQILFVNIRKEYTWLYIEVINETN